MFSPRGLPPRTKLKRSGWSDDDGDEGVVEELSPSLIRQLEFTMQTAITPGRLKKKNSKNQPIKVVLRIRPSCSGSDSDQTMTLVGSDQVLVQAPVNSQAHKSGQEPSQRYTFSRVFGAETSQTEIFESVAKPLLDDLVDKGKDALILTYGITNSGKTHTILGGSGKGHAGILQRSIEQLFLRTDSSEFEIWVSYLEIYNDRIFDLLPMNDQLKQCAKSSALRLDEAQDSARTALKMVHNKAGAGYVSGLREVHATSVIAAMTLLHEGAARRAIAGTQLNQESSRSHTVFAVRLVRAGPKKQSFGKLTVVDLAGAERQSRSGCVGEDRCRETGKINQSLMQLGLCLETIRWNQAHSGRGIRPRDIPFRDSKLTHLLKDYLMGGWGQTVMIATASADPIDHDETCHALKFAALARDVSCQSKVDCGQIAPAFESTGAIEERCFDGREAEIDSLFDEIYDLKKSLLASERNRVLLETHLRKELGDEMSRQAAEIQEQHAEELSLLRKRTEEVNRRRFSLWKERHLLMTQVEQWQEGDVPSRALRNSDSDQQHQVIEAGVEDQFVKNVHEDRAIQTDQDVQVAQIDQGVQVMRINSRSHGMQTVQEEKVMQIDHGVQFMWAQENRATQTAQVDRVVTNDQEVQVQVFHTERSVQADFEEDVVCINLCINLADHSLRESLEGSEKLDSRYYLLEDHRNVIEELGLEACALKAVIEKQQVIITAQNALLADLAAVQHMRLRLDTRVQHELKLLRRRDVEQRNLIDEIKIEAASQLKSFAKERQEWDEERLILRRTQETRLDDHPFDQEQEFEVADPAVDIPCCDTVSSPTEPALFAEVSSIELPSPVNACRVNAGNLRYRSTSTSIQSKSQGRAINDATFEGEHISQQVLTKKTNRLLASSNKENDLAKSVSSVTVKKQFGRHRSNEDDIWNQMLDQPFGNAFPCVLLSPLTTGPSRGKRRNKRICPPAKRSKPSIDSDRESEKNHQLVERDALEAKQAVLAPEPVDVASKESAPTRIKRAQARSTRGRQKKYQPDDSNEDVPIVPLPLGALDVNAPACRTTRSRRQY